MKTFLLAALLAFAPVAPYHSDVSSTATRTTTLPAVGYATYYSPGIFEKVVKNQLRWGAIQADGCPDCDGYAAMLWPSDVGRVVCVEGLRLWVVDNAADKHRAGLIKRGWLIDVDRQTWAALGFPNAPTMVSVTDC